MIELIQTEQGVVLPVRAQPGSRRNEIRGAHQGALKVCVTQVAEKGKANQAIIKQLSKSLGLRKSQIQLLSGELNADKRFLLSGVSVAELRERLQAIVAE